MSQRPMSSIEAHGGVEQAVRAAKARGVHLVQLADDHGKLLVAARRHPFRTLRWAMTGGNAGLPTS